jgi:RNA polymerase sigma-B factor
MTPSATHAWNTERTQALFERVHDDPSARDEVIELYTPLARYLARRFDGRREPLDDLVQVALVGLIKAVDRFEPDREVKFTTYASATIVGELKRHFRDKGWAVRVPRRLQESGMRVSRAVVTLSQDLGRSPTIREVGTLTELSDEEVLEAMDAANAYSARSLDARVDDEGTTELDRLRDDDDSLDRMVGWASAAPAIRALPERERTILYLRFFHGQTQSEIAHELDMSQMHVSRLLSRALQKLRDEMEPQEGGSPASDE